MIQSFYIIDPDTLMITLGFESKGKRYYTLITYDPESAQKMLRTMESIIGGEDYESASIAK